MTSIMQLGPDAQRQVAGQLRSMAKAAASQLVEGQKKKEIAVEVSAREVTLRLPLPPSVNHSKHLGRFSTVATRAWRTAAGWAIREQMAALGNPPAFAGKVAVSVMFHDRGDIDNRLKPLLDLLQGCLVYLNDRQVKRLLVEMGDCEDCVVTVRLA